jgi:hypothetical protein
MLDDKVSEACHENTRFAECNTKSGADWANVAFGGI